MMLSSIVAVMSRLMWMYDNALQIYVTNNNVVAVYVVS